MPRRRNTYALTRTRGGRSMAGSGFMKFLKKVHRFLKKTKLLSKGAKMASAMGVPYSEQIAKAGKVAGAVGYGRRRRRTYRRRNRGGALRLAGQRGPIMRRRRGCGLRVPGGAQSVIHSRRASTRRLRSKPMYY